MPVRLQIEPNGPHDGFPVRRDIHCNHQIQPVVVGHADNSFDGCPGPNLDFDDVTVEDFDFIAILDFDAPVLVAGPRLPGVRCQKEGTDTREGAARTGRDSEKLMIETVFHKSV